MSSVTESKRAADVAKLQADLAASDVKRAETESKIEQADLRFRSGPIHYFIGLEENLGIGDSVRAAQSKTQTLTENLAVQAQTGGQPTAIAKSYTGIVAESASIQKEIVKSQQTIAELQKQKEARKAYLESQITRLNQPGAQSNYSQMLEFESYSRELHGLESQYGRQIAQQERNISALGKVSEQLAKAKQTQILGITSKPQTYANPEYAKKGSPEYLGNATKNLNAPAWTETQKHIQEGDTTKLFAKSAYVQHEATHPLLSDMEKGKTVTNYTLSLTEGGIGEKQRRTPEQKQADIENIFNVKKFVRSAQENKSPFVILTIDGKNKQVPTDQAFRYYVEAARSNKPVLLSTPTIINLTESLSLGEGKMQKTGYKQDKQGKIETIISTPAPIPKQYDFNQIIPLSVEGNELTGITRGKNAGELITFSLEPESRTVKLSPITARLNTGQKWIEDLEKISKERLAKNPNDPLGKVGLGVGSFGKEFYSIFPYGYNVIEQNIAIPYVNMLRDQTSKLPRQEYEPAFVPRTASLEAMEDIYNLKNPLTKGSRFEKYNKGLTPEQKLGEATGFIIPLVATGGIRGAETLTLFTREALNMARTGKYERIAGILERVRPLSPIGKAKVITRALDPLNIYGIEAIQPLKTVGRFSTTGAIQGSRGIIEKAISKIKEPFATAKTTTETATEPTLLAKAETATEPVPEIIPAPEIIPTPAPITKVAGVSASLGALTSQITGRIGAITRKGGLESLEKIKGRITQPSRYVGYLGIEGGEVSAKAAAKAKQFDFEITATGKRKSVKPKEVIIPAESKTPAVMIDTGKKGLTGIVRSEPMKEIANQMGIIVSGDIGKVDVKRLGLKLVSKKGETPLFAARLPKGAKARAEFLLRIGEAEKLGYITRVTDIEFLPTKEALKYAKMKNVRIEKTDPLANVLGSEKARRYAVKVAPFYEVKQVLGATREIKVKGIEKPLSVEEAFKQGKLPKGKEGKLPYDVEIGKTGFDKYLTDIGLSKALEPTERASKVMRGFEDFAKPIKESKGFAGSEGKARAISKEKALDIAKQISPLTKGVKETQKPIIPQYGLGYAAIDSSAGMFETQVTGKYNISPYEKRLEINEPRLDTGTSINIKSRIDSFTGLKQPSILSEGLKTVSPQKTDIGLRIDTISKAGLREQEKLRNDLLSKTKTVTVLRSGLESKLRVSEVEKLATKQKEKLVEKLIPRIKEKIKEEPKPKFRIIPFEYPKVKLGRQQREKREKIDTTPFIGNVLESNVGAAGFKKFDIKYGSKQVGRQTAINRAITNRGRQSFTKSSHSNKSAFGKSNNKRIRF